MPRFRLSEMRIARQRYRGRRDRRPERHRGRDQRLPQRPLRQMTLTNAAIKNAAAGDVLRDDKVRGLHLRATAGGKAFYLYYRTRAGQERRPKLGSYPTLQLDAAREIGRDLLEQVAKGEDPAGNWAAQRAAPTVGGLCDRFLKWAEEEKKPRTHKDYKYMVERHIRPRWGSKKVADITNSDAEKFHR